MEELRDIPDEFIGPILPSLELLERGNIHIYAKTNSFLMNYWRTFFTIPCMMLFIISLTPNMIKVFKGEIQLDEMARVVSIYVVCIQSTVKTTIVVLKRNEIKSLIAQLGGMWRTENLLAVQITKKNTLLKRLKLCYTVYYWMTIISAWQFMLAPILETVFRRYILQQECELLFPFYCTFPFDTSGNWKRYIGVYIFSNYSNSVLMSFSARNFFLAVWSLGLWAMDGSRFDVSNAHPGIRLVIRVVYFFLGTEFLMVTLCSQLATEFTLLQEDLLNIKPEENPEEIRNIAIKHQKLISLAVLLDDIFNKIIFVDLISPSISICLFGFAAKVARGVVDMANNFVALMCLTVPVFNLCYYCELLSEASAGVADSAYHNLWYKGDIRYQKVLWFIITRSQKPCCMTSMKYNPIDLKTFTTVLSTTWSYFSLASSMYESES